MHIITSSKSMQIKNVSIYCYNSVIIDFLLHCVIDQDDHGIKYEKISLKYLKISQDIMRYHGNNQDI